MTQGPLTFTLDGRFFRRGGERCRILGVSYGPFIRPVDGGDNVRRDLDTIQTLGFNALRLYELPGRPFLQECAARGLSVFPTLKWASNTDFSREEESIRERLRREVAGLRGAPALGGYFVGNEVSAPLVRWLGRWRVNRFLESLLVELREQDEGALFAYANYPSTEYLHPRGGNFTAFNLYLEEREPLERYLRRLHHLADGQPLVISEYGLDSLRNGEERQAEILGWMTETLHRGGAAGSFLFSYTDEWYNGGRQVEDWRFGLVTASRERKPAAGVVSEVLAKTGRGWPALPEPRPLVTVIVCTFNGHARLGACLRSLAEVNYEPLEILVVDDGSRPGIEKLVREEAPGVRYVQQAHAGLSAARNRGAREARGDLLVFTDDDCEVDPDWVAYLVEAFQTEGWDACGGPNLAPQAESLMAWCIQRAPGNPAHVMLDDVRAEHLPGCNLAVRREAFDAVGGFRETYRVAGDDVDFCWRLDFAGKRMGYAPLASVWHHRRSTWWRFLRQQMGYGRAEALLLWDHPQKCGAGGGIRWQGTVYASVWGREPGRPVIYFGRDGLAPFQTIYHNSGERGQGPLGMVLRSALWWQMTAVAGVLALGYGGAAAGWVVWGMFTASAAAWVPVACGAWVPRGGRGVREIYGILLLWWVVWSSMVARQAVRWLHAPPGGVSWPSKAARWARWSDRGLGREAVLDKVRAQLEAEGRETEAVNPWPPFDLILPASRWIQPVLLSVTEFHERDERLTRFAVKAFPRPLLRGLLVLLLAFTLGQAMGDQDAGLLWGLVLTGAVAAAVQVHVNRLRDRWRAVVDAAAAEVGLECVRDEGFTG